MAKEREIKFKTRNMTMPTYGVILIKRPGRMEWEEFQEHIMIFAEDVVRRFGPRHIVVGVDNFRDIQLIDEERMKRYDWVREERVFMYKEDVELEGQGEEE